MIVAVGLPRKTVRVVAYDSTWPTHYESEALLIRIALGVATFDLAQIGSTAVPGLEAKPIIDNGHYAASVADGIPIDSYTPQGTQAFLSVFASLGLSQLILSLLGVLLLLKYRPLVPIYLLVLLVEYLARKGVNAYMPIARSGNAPGGAINWAIFGVMLLAFVLSMRQRNVPQLPPEA